MDIHALIHDFLQQQTVVSLVADTYGRQDAQFIKAGVVPFLRIRGGQQTDPALSASHGAGQKAAPETYHYSYYVMKPVARHRGLAKPQFQLCKGTRMHYEPQSGWVDMRDGQTPNAKHESLAATALREGMEEVGLALENVAKLYDVGPYRFSSAKTGVERHMWLFAAEVKEGQRFAPTAALAATTDACNWLSLAEFTVVGRDDHLYILRDIEAKLKAHYKE